MKVNEFKIGVKGYKLFILDLPEDDKRGDGHHKSKKVPSRVTTRPHTVPCQDTYHAMS